MHFEDLHWSTHTHTHAAVQVAFSVVLKHSNRCAAQPPLVILNFFCLFPKQRQLGINAMLCANQIFTGGHSPCWQLPPNYDHYPRWRVAKKDQSESFILLVLNWNRFFFLSIKWTDYKRSKLPLQFLFVAKIQLTQSACVSSEHNRGPQHTHTVYQLAICADSSMSLVSSSTDECV